MIVYSVASKQSFDMARIIRDKILNHLVSALAALLLTAADAIASPGHGMGSNRHRWQ